ncbi:MAG: four helix bundle protein [bacterium]|nr:four helix bundle protein [bacterium]
MTFQFEKLLVYPKALDFADQVCSTTEQSSRGYGFPLDQLNRAVLSISANIAEGNGGFTKADRENFFSIVEIPSSTLRLDFPLAKIRRIRAGQ